MAQHGMGACTLPSHLLITSASRSLPPSSPHALVLYDPGFRPTYLQRRRMGCGLAAKPIPTTGEGRLQETMPHPCLLGFGKEQTQVQDPISTSHRENKSRPQSRSVPTPPLNGIWPAAGPALTPTLIVYRPRDAKTVNTTQNTPCRSAGRIITVPR